MAKSAYRPPEDSPSDSNTEDDDQQNSSPPGSSKKGKSSRTPLSEHQKSTNHKDAENKRRNAIREQFTELSRLVPGAEGHERSEYLMLQMTIAHLKEETEEARRLGREIELNGGTLAEGEKIREDEWGGRDWIPRNVREYDEAKTKKSASSTKGSTDAIRTSKAKMNDL